MSVRDEMLETLEALGPENVYEFRLLHALLTLCYEDLSVAPDVLPEICGYLKWTETQMRAVVRMLERHGFVQREHDSLFVLAPAPEAYGL